MDFQKRKAGTTGADIPVGRSGTYFPIVSDPTVRSCLQILYYGINGKKHW